MLVMKREEEVTAAIVKLEEEINATARRSRTLCVSGARSLSRRRSIHGFSGPSQRRTS